MPHTCGNAGGFPGGNPLQVPGAAELPGRCPPLSVSDCARSGSAAAMFSAVTKSMLDCVLAARAAAALSAALPIAGNAARAWAGRTHHSAMGQGRGRFENVMLLGWIAAVTPLTSPQTCKSGLALHMATRALVLT